MTKRVSKRVENENQTLRERERERERERASREMKFKVYDEKVNLKLAKTKILLLSRRSRYLK